MSGIPDGLKLVYQQNQDIQQKGAEFISKVKDLQDIVPIVNQTMQMSEAFTKALGSFPTGAMEINWSGVNANYVEANAQFGKLKVTYLKEAGAAGTTGSALLTATANNFAGMFDAGSLAADKKLDAWYQGYFRPVIELQTQPDRIAFISGRIKKLHAGAEMEFEQSVTEYQQCRAGTASPSSAGIAMRNVLETLNGRLRGLAISFDSSAKNRVNANATGWMEMAKIVGRGGPASLQVMELMAQKTIYDRLRGGNALTAIAKNDKIPSATEWESLYSEYIGLLYTVLGLVDFRDGT